MERQGWLPLGYSENSNEKESDRRTHHRPGNYGNGEEIDRSRTAGGDEAVRGLRGVMHAINRSACGGRRRLVLGVPALEDQRVAGVGPADVGARITRRNRSSGSRLTAVTQVVST